MRFADTTDNENIVKIIKEFGATSKETAITLEQVIDKGIQDGLCEIYPRDGHDGHPWYPRVSLMMGIGSESNVANHEELFLHRYKAKKAVMGVTCLMVESMISVYRNYQIMSVTSEWMKEIYGQSLIFR